MPELEEPPVQSDQPDLSSQQAPSWFPQDAGGDTGAPVDEGRSQYLSQQAPQDSGPSKPEMSSSVPSPNQPQIGDDLQRRVELSEFQPSSQQSSQPVVNGPGSRPRIPGNQDPAKPGGAKGAANAVKDGRETAKEVAGLAKDAAAAATGNVVAAAKLALNAKKIRGLAKDFIKKNPLRVWALFIFGVSIIILLFIVGMAAGLANRVTGDNPGAKQTGSWSAVGDLGLSAEFNYNNVLPDAFVTNSKSMSVQDIQAFLVQRKSPLATMDASKFGPMGEGRSAAQIIYDAGQGPSKMVEPGKLTMPVNPQLIMMYLQKESSAITKADNLDKATGFACPDGRACDDSKKGFAAQVYGMADSFRRYYRDLEGSKKSTHTGWRVKSARQIKTDSGEITRAKADGLNPAAYYTVTPENKATAAIYTYTPHVYLSAYTAWKITKLWFGAELVSEAVTKRAGPKIASRLGLPDGTVARLVSSKVTNAPVDAEYLRKPVGGQRFGSKRSYGGHAGIDFGTQMKPNKPAYAIGPGKVAALTAGGGTGCQVIIDHGDGVTSRYLHLALKGSTDSAAGGNSITRNPPALRVSDCDFKVTEGQVLTGGEQLGLMSNTGQNQSGEKNTHLHLEIRYGGKFINPTPFFELK